MTRIKTSASSRCRCCLPLHILPVIVILAALSTESRYIRREETASDQSNVLEEDVDLESVVEDYYDDLWQYLENSAETKMETERQNRNRKWKFADYDYMSDMAAASPDAATDDNKFQGVSKDLVEGTDRESLTNSSGPTFNGTYGDIQLSDVVRANRESNSEEEYALRSKEMRLKSIISQVLSFRGGSPKGNETIPDSKHYNALREIYERNMKKIKTDDWTASYTEKVQSFYPSCDVPRNTDEEVWSDPYAMNLLFDLDYPSPQEDATIMIVSAKLRLYKLPQENFSAPNAEPMTVKPKADKSHGGLGILLGDDDRQIRVSVYWYTRSLRRHRAKKKLLDSQMLSMGRPKWAEFNIRAAVRTWKDSGKNFGLVVTVEDEDGVHLPAEQYIHSMNCSKWTATVRPIPSIIMDKAHQYYFENLLSKQNETLEEGKPEEEKRRIYPYEPLLYPIIDLRTREVPNSEVKNLALINSAKMALESKFLNLTRRGLNLNNNSITIFLKNYNGGNLEPKPDKFPPRKQTETKDSKVSYFQNVPIGSPSTNQNRNLFISVMKKNPGSSGEETESRGYRIESPAGDRRTVTDGNGERVPEEERETPRIRHGKRHWETHQKSNSRLRNDHNATSDHH